ncbi:hypothetical protein AAFN47_01655 [Hoeflea sp. CAU 1731]
MKQLESTDHYVQHEPSPEEIREELERVLGSPDFRATAQRRTMLSFLIKETLAGRSDRLKGYTIGVTAFGRDEGYDPQSDPVVRFEARRLRSDLDSYYVSAGLNNPLRITIPKGRYVPVFIAKEVNDRASAFAPTPNASSSEHAEPGVVAAVLKAGRIAYIAVAILLLVGAVLAFNNLSVNYLAAKNSNVTSSLQAPAVQMLPFDVPGNHQKDQFLAAGILNHLASQLSSFPNIRIYFPNMGPDKFDAGIDALTEDNRPPPTHTLTGSLQSNGSDINIIARLTETQSGKLTWIKNYNRKVDTASLIKVQDEITADIATTLGEPFGVINSALAGSLSEQHIPSMSSYECVLRGYYYKRNFSPELYTSLYKCIHHAVLKDPGYPEAWAMLAWVYLDAVRYSFLGAPDPNITYETALEAGKNAIELDPGSVLGLNAMSAINHYQGNYSEGERFARLALESNPNNPYTLVQLGWRMAIRGNFAEGIPLVERAIELSVNPPGWYFHLLTIDRLMKGDGEGMLIFAERGSNDESALSQSLVAMAYGILKNRKAAEQAVARMNEIAPGYDPIGRLRIHGATQEIIAAATKALEYGWPDLHSEL